MTEVTKRTPEQVDVPSRDGAFVHGLTLEGARWDDKAGLLDDARPKELFCPLPVRRAPGAGAGRCLDLGRPRTDARAAPQVMLIRAVTVDKAELKDCYQCPVYVTEQRFRQEIFTAQLKSKHSWVKWTLLGVCLFLDVV